MYLSHRRAVKLQAMYRFNRAFKAGIYGKCSKISNTFLFLFSNKMLVFRAGIQKILVRIANREDLGLPCLSKPFWQATSVRNFRTFTIHAVEGLCQNFDLMLL